MRVKSITICALLSMVMGVTFACRQEESFGGLSKGDFEAIVEFSSESFGKGFIGLKVDGENLTGTVVLPSGASSHYQGLLSPDPLKRWLKIDWKGKDDGCGEAAHYHLEMAWASLESLTGTGKLAITCGTQPPKEIELNAQLLWDPRYAP